MTISTASSRYSWVNLRYFGMMTLPPREKFSLLGSLSGGSNTPQGVALDDLLGGAGQVVGDQDGGFVVAQAGDGELPQRAGVLGEFGRGGVDDADSAGFGAGAGDRHRGPGAGG